MAKSKIESFASQKIALQSPIEVLLEFMQDAGSADDINELYAFLISRLKSSFQTDEVVVYSIDRKTSNPQKKYHRIGKTGTMCESFVEELDSDHFLIKEVLSTREPVIIQTNPDNRSFAPSGTPVINQLGIPMIYNDQAHSVIYIQFESNTNLKSKIDQFAKALTQHLNLLISKLQDNEYTQLFKVRVRKIIVSKVSELEIALEKADRYNQSLKDFAYIVSHDLREPLRTINSYIKLLERRYSDHFDEDATTFMHFITDGVERMDALIKDLLVFSRIENSVYHFEETDFNNLLVLTKNSLKLKLQESNGIIHSDPLPTLWVSRTHISLLLQNLIDNAIKFRVPDRDPVIKITVTESDQYWQFSVQDNGSGMDLDHKNNERIFKIFQRLQSFNSEIPGTGIGLAICKNIVLAHGGNIWVNSSPGQGSTFHFTISKSLRPL
ncbi:MAG: GHKL domain-containing protein [Bacteroidia bacterium]|nr:GHKL domain-containing protein [Bacteroidia bacterium]